MKVDNLDSEHTPPANSTNEQASAARPSHAHGAAAHTVHVSAEESHAAAGLELKPAPGILLTTGIVALVAGSAIGFYFGRPGSAAAEAPGEKKADDPNTIKLEATQLAGLKIDKAALQSFHGEKVTTGRIAFNDDKVTPVYFPFTGRVLKHFAQPGDAVKKGDPLIEIDSPDVVQPQSDLIGAISSLKNSQTALRLAQKNEG